MTDHAAFVEAARKDGQKIERLIRHFYQGLPDRDCFLDGGGHQGYHTSHARLFFSRVISVEASPGTYVEHVRNQIALAEKTPAEQPPGDGIPTNAALH